MPMDRTVAGVGQAARSATVTCSVVQSAAVAARPYTTALPWTDSSKPLPRLSAE